MPASSWIAKRVGAGRLLFLYPPHTMADTTRCGNRRCTFTGEMRRCSACKTRFYCVSFSPILSGLRADFFFPKSTECQAVDWPTHRRSCTPESAASLNHHLIAKYVAKHHHNYTDFALEALGFFTSYHHLEGHHRALFMHTGTRFLHVILQRVDSPGRGAHNKLEFANAADTSHLELAEMLVTRLTAYFPSVLLGFTVFNPLGQPGIRVTTVTHTFVWPGPAATSVGAHKVIEDIVDAESELQKIGKTGVGTRLHMMF